MSADWWEDRILLEELWCWLLERGWAPFNMVLGRVDRDAFFHNPEEYTDLYEVFASEVLAA